ncbi:Glycosyltransferase involved in cell wall bisynthesis [Daejeonella rubra]|uniref:Glycosyltransferase involved in cell wall bisynthesis n=2 Tax=Daejeonella rubra TaxID=990371 RepID=A0A1G9QRR9_9SPHI|nr:Glycosyltransferase involved in cell wall bisynthesis [Daejeonella rubra]
MEALLENNEVAVFTPKIHHEDIKIKLANMGVDIYENELNGSNVSIFSDLAYMVRLFQVIRQTRPDVFFPYTLKPVIYGSFIAKICKVKHIVPMLTGLGYNFMNGNKKTPLVKKIVRGMLKFSLKQNDQSNLILQNKDDYDTLLNQGIIDKEYNTHVVNGSGVDLSYYLFSRPEHENLSFLMIARLINAKGIREYFDAAQCIRLHYPYVKFKLIGPYDDNIDSIDSDLYNKIISGDVIEYLGEVSDVRPYIKASSVVVLPSYYGEGIPRCLLEAMAMGRAIITCDSVGCKETVNLSENLQTGFLVPVKNVKALTDKIQHFILHPDDTMLFGKNGREYARRKFDVNKVNKHMLEILQA